MSINSMKGAVVIPIRTANSTMASNFNKDVYFAQLEMLVNIDSGFDSLDGSTRLIDFFEHNIKGLKFNTHRVNGHGSFPDCLIATNKNTDRYDIMMVGHVDTAFEKGTCQRSPYRTDGINAYGPGIADMKAGVLAIYHILKCLPAKTLDALSICVAINADEEIFLPHHEQLLIEYASRSNYVFVYESAFPDGSHCVHRKGRLRYQLEFNGISVHSGYVFETRNASTILEMSHWIQTLNSLTSREKGISFNVGTVSGGTAVNMVPEQATMNFEFRMWDIYDQKMVEDLITHMLNHPYIDGTSVRVKEYLSKPPMSPSQQTLNYIDHARSLLEVHGYDFSTRPRGGMSDANHIFKYTSVCIDGMGPRGELNTSNSDYESIVMDSVEECIEISLLLFADLAAQREKDRR